MEMGKEILFHRRIAGNDYRTIENYSHFFIWYIFEIKNDYRFISFFLSDFHLAGFLLRRIV